ncbi:MAG: ATP-binding protein [Methylococcales bacterium]|nr:ATP-binding protein [Methylococcales bacterium]
MMSEATNNPIYLTKVEIRGLWGRYDIDWNLNSDVNVLAGGNGSGKTTILNSIYQALSVKSNIYSERLDHIKLFLNNGVWLDLNSFKLPDDEDKLGKPKFEIKTNVELPPHDIKKEININIISTFDTESKPQELLKKADNKVNTGLDFELWKLQKEYTKYQVRIYKTNSEVNRATHIRFLAIIDELFLETHKRVNANKEELEFLLGDKEISAYKLSSGEKQLLIILLTVLIQDNKPSILFMDEPEISLHIEWQRKLITYIRELNPNVQLIIATHSPDIIMDGWLDKIFNIQDLVITDNHI